MLSQQEISLGFLMAVSYVPGMIFCVRWFARIHIANHQSDITCVMRRCISLLVCGQIGYATTYTIFITYSLRILKRSHVKM